MSIHTLENTQFNLANVDTKIRMLKRFNMYQFPKYPFYTVSICVQYCTGIRHRIHKIHQILMWLMVTLKRIILACGLSCQFH